MQYSEVPPAGLTTGMVGALTMPQSKPFRPGVQVLLHIAMTFGVFTKHLCPVTLQHPVSMQFSFQVEQAASLGAISTTSSFPTSALRPMCAAGVLRRDMAHATPARPTRPAATTSRPELLRQCFGDSSHCSPSMSLSASMSIAACIEI